MGRGQSSCPGHLLLLLLLSLLLLLLLFFFFFFFFYYYYYYFIVVLFLCSSIKGNNKMSGKIRDDEIRGRHAMRAMTTTGNNFRGGKKSNF